MVWANLLEVPIGYTGMVDMLDRNYEKILRIPATKCLKIAKSKSREAEYSRIERPENICRNEFRSWAAGRMNSDAERKIRDEKEVMTFSSQSII